MWVCVCVLRLYTCDCECVCVCFGCTHVIVSVCVCVCLGCTCVCVCVGCTHVDVCVCVLRLCTRNCVFCACAWAKHVCKYARFWVCGVKSKTRFKSHVLHQRTAWITPRLVDMKLHSKWSKVHERWGLSRLILAGITASVHWNGTG